jgi:tetratricopeptide (TPR) repeat protein
MSTAAREAVRLMKEGHWVAALDRVEEALTAGAPDPGLLMCRAQCLMAVGRGADAFAAAQAAERCDPANAAIADSAGTLYSHGKEYRRALASYDRAIALAPRSAQYLYNRATVRRFLGLLADAESDYDQVIALNPNDFEAYKNRADLRVQSDERNHVAELLTVLGEPFGDWRGEVQVRYALAKEYEDLGEYVKSFEQLRRGAKQRRDHSRYDVATDVATVDWIIEAFPAVGDPLEEDHTEDAPIFVVGLPRSGTTLVERILSSHSALFSAGELDCFAVSIVDAVRRRCGRAQMARQELVAQSASVDFAALGKDYIRRAYRVAGGSGRFIDKMPLNYLYCALIRRALPHAKIVHVTRTPMAACYAMYKTLFQDGYPFSYELEELGCYYIAYRRLMAHWYKVIPQSIHELSYESLVADQVGETRKLLAFCGLDWQDACAHFHENPTASTTASAAQIRRPIYGSSVEQWRHYAKELAPLQRQLQDGGVDV